MKPVDVSAPTSRSRATRARLKAAGLLVAVFLCGAASGAGLATARVARAARRIGEGAPETFNGRLRLALYDRALGLSTEQMAKILPIVERFSVDRFALLPRLEPELSRLRARERAEVRPLLTPSQQVEWDRQMTLLDAKIGADRRETPPPAP